MKRMRIEVLLLACAVCLLASCKTAPKADAPQTAPEAVSAATSEGW